MGRTTSRPGTWSAALFEENAVKGTSATSARNTQTPVASSKMLSVYSMGVHASSLMVAIAALTLGFRRTVTDAWARRGAWRQLWAPRRTRSEGGCQVVCVSDAGQMGLQVGVDAVGVDEGELAEGCFPALDEGAFDEFAGGFAGGARG